MDLVPARDGRPYCDEGWPKDSFRKAFGFTTSVMQFVIPICHYHILLCPGKSLSVFDTGRVRDPENVNPDPEPQPGCSRQIVNTGPIVEKATSLKYSPKTDTVRMQVNAEEVVTAV
ncbi:neuropeptide Y receptor type 2 [Caerostris extrusa]|uniref:Neuropeptide Y receptor type 2 n=1 Tax=Caerostris extrusa TaxID=172846 RepID=A0AAV4V3Y6_CAEEX|nr:neuropeptide Y receptor type 2 [Caerostris extrusa]